LNKILAKPLNLNNKNFKSAEFQDKYYEKHEPLLKNYETEYSFGEKG